MLIANMNIFLTRSSLEVMVIIFRTNEHSQSMVRHYCIPAITPFLASGFFIDNAFFTIYIQLYTIMALCQATILTKVTISADCAISQQASPPFQNELKNLAI
jgi:hypothetical protein